MAQKKIGIFFPSVNLKKITKLSKFKKFKKKKPLLLTISTTISEDWICECFFILAWNSCGN